MESTPAAKKRAKRRRLHRAPVHAVIIVRIEVQELAAKKTVRQAPPHERKKPGRGKQVSLPTFTYTPHQKKLLAEIENDEVGDFVEDPPREDA